MGTIKVWLRDDTLNGFPLPALTPVNGVPVKTDNDPAATVDTRMNPTLTVRLRVRTGYSDDGVPQFDWVVLVVGEAIMFEEREEFDAEAGLTLVKATTTMLYGGTSEVTETASVTSDNGVRYRLLAVRQVPGRLQFDMQRIS